MSTTARLLVALFAAALLAACGSTQTPVNPLAPSSSSLRATPAPSSISGTSATLDSSHAGSEVEDEAGESSENGEVDDETGESPNNGHVDDEAGESSENGEVDDEAGESPNNGHVEDEAGESHNNGQNNKVEGPVSGLSGICPSLAFSIGGTTVKTTAATQFKDVRCGAVANGMKVEAKGTLASGVLTATEIEK
jgi:hypothetical protein